MRPLRLLALAFATLVGAAASAHASTIDLSWDQCAPIVVDKSFAPGSIGWLQVSVTGQSEAHRAYEFFIAIADANDHVPDAWRFDVGGCQPAGSVVIEHLWPDMLKTCPAFQGPNQSIQIKSYEPAPAYLGIPGSIMVAYLANSYPAGVLSPSPATRYVLGRILFDHSNSVPEEEAAPGLCGGLARPMCLTLIPGRVNWLTPNGEQRSFDIGNGGITTNGGGCLPVPATSSTWGAIKGQYRR